jgi:hypothetical protein
VGRSAVMAFWSKKPPEEKAAVRSRSAGETPTTSEVDPSSAFEWDEQPERSSVPTRERADEASTQAHTEAPEPTPPSEAPADTSARAARREHVGERSTMIPARRERVVVESQLVRLIATGGVVGIGVILGAVLVSQHVQGWIDGLVISGVTVILAAVMWSSRRL